MATKKINVTAETPKVVEIPTPPPVTREYLQSSEVAVNVPFRQALVSGILVFITCLGILLVSYWSDAWPLLVATIFTDILWVLLLWRNHTLIMAEIRDNKDYNRDGVIGNPKMRFYMPREGNSTKVGTVIADAKKLNGLAKAVVAWRYSQIKKRGETILSQRKWCGRFKPYKPVEYNQLIGQLVAMNVIAPVSSYTNDRGYAETQVEGVPFFDYVSSDQFLIDVAREAQEGSILALHRFK